MFAAGGRTADTSETSLEPAAGQELLDTVRHDAAQRSRAGLEALLVGRDITVEVPLEHLIENGDFRMAGTINTRGLANPSARIRPVAMPVLRWNVLSESKQQRVVSHRPQFTSCGRGPAKRTFSFPPPPPDRRQYMRICHWLYTTENSRRNF